MKKKTLLDQFESELRRRLEECRYFEYQYEGRFEESCDIDKAIDEVLYLVGKYKVKLERPDESKKRD